MNRTGFPNRSGRGSEDTRHLSPEMISNPDDNYANLIMIQTYLFSGLEPVIE